MSPVKVFLLESTIIETLSDGFKMSGNVCLLPLPLPPVGVSPHWLTAEDTCGGTLRSSSGLISSFDFPGGDSPGAGAGGGGGGVTAGGLGSSGECKWTILADPGDTISLVFTEFQMEEKSDYLEVEGSEPPSIWWVRVVRREGWWGSLAYIFFSFSSRCCWFLTKLN